MRNGLNSVVLYLDYTPPCFRTVIFRFADLYNITSSRFLLNLFHNAPLALLECRVSAIIKIVSTLTSRVANDYGRSLNLLISTIS